MLSTAYQMGEPGYHAQAKAALVGHYKEHGKMPPREAHPEGLWDIEAWDAINTLFQELSKAPEEAASVIQENAVPLMKLHLKS